MIGLARQFLHPAASGFEIALGATEFERLLNINAELIIENWDPYLVQEKHINHLAYGFGVRLWEDYWTTDTKRRWIANQLTFQSLVGTLSAHDMALEPSGYNIVYEITPPQGFFVSPDISPEAYNAWLRLMPELRIYYSSDIGTSPTGDLFLGDETEPYDPRLSGFVDVDFIPPDDGPILVGRKAILRIRGEDIPLKSGYSVITKENGKSEEIIIASTTGHDDFGFFITQSFVGPDDPAFLNADALEPVLYKVRRDENWSYRTDRLSMTTLKPTLDPVTPRSEIDSDTLPAGPFMFLDSDFIEPQAAESFTGIDYGGLMIADRIYLFDPDVAAPMTEGWSFVGIDRIGIEPHTIYALVDLHTKELADAWYVEKSYLGESFVMDEDDSHRERAFRAMTVAKAARDRVLVSYAPCRRLTVSDRLTSTLKVGDWKPKEL